LGIGGNDLKVFAISTSVLKPDFYSTSFLVTDNQDRLPEITKTEIQFIQEQQIVFWILIPVIILIIVIILFLKRRK
jgi:peptide/nickel transport system substrate-binding protein